MYSTLYNLRQKAGKYVSRQWFLDDAKSLPWVRDIEIKRTDKLNLEQVRGLIFSHNRQTHGGMENFDYTIILAAGMETEYERFVTIKELMHCYFPPVDKHVRYMTGSALALEAHMNAFFGNATNNPAQDQAEKMGLWMALGVICTEGYRQHMMQKYGKKSQAVADVSKEMRIPAKQAKSLISNLYDAEIQKLIA